MTTVGSHTEVSTGVDRLGGDDVVGDRVDVIGEGVAAHRRPRLRHPFEGGPAEQQRVGGEVHLHEVVLQLLVGVLERPLVRVVDVAVESGVSEVDDLAHGVCFSWSVMDRVGWFGVRWLR
jgi:hypothetical protein